MEEIEPAPRLLPEADRSCANSVRARQEIRLADRLQHQFGCHL